MRRLAMWLRALFRRERVESEMEKEMRLHIELQTEHNISLGMSPDEARRRALVAFGGVEVAKEQVRDERRTRWLEQLASDVRFALRGFRMRPAFTGGVIILIALGVGVNTAIFSVFNHLLLFPLPYADGNRMVELMAMGGGGTVLMTPMQSQVDQWRARTRLVESIVAYQAGQGTIGDTTSDRPLTMTVANVTPGALAFIGKRPALGRDIQPSDTLSDAPSVVLLSHELWQSRYGGRGDALGQSIQVQGEARQIVGVLPPDAKLPFSEAKLFMALRSSGGDRPMEAMAKLRAGVTVEQVNRELVTLFPKLDRGSSEDPPTVQRAVDGVGGSTRRIVYLMLVAVFILLIVTCANVANLLMSRAWARQREFAIRAAMGAGRGRLVRQVLTESLLLSSIGAVLALGVARLTLRVLVMAQPSGNLDFENARLEPTVLAWCFGLALLTGALFGLAPALFVSGHRAGESLKSGTQAATGSRAARRVRGALVVAEVALSAILLVTSGLLVRSIAAMSRAEVGVDTRGLWGVSVRLTDSSFGDSVSRRALVRSMVERVRALPGVEGATMAMDLPPRFAIGMGQVEIEGIPTTRGDSLMAVSVTGGRADFFELTGIRILQGRPYTDDERPTDRAGGTNEIVVNESFARRFFPGRSALGAKIRRGNGPWATVVGIAADVRVPGDQRGARTQTQLYLSMGAAPRQEKLLIRSRASMEQMLPSVEAAVHDAAPRAKVSRPETSDAFIGASRAQHRFMMLLVGTFGILAVVLAAFGLHAVIAYAVHQRTREIGVRVALGAESSEVARMIVGQGMRLSIAGIAFGVLSGALAARAMRAMLYGVGPNDPVTMAAVSALLLGVAVVATYAPARRAARVDPMEALRAE